MKLNSTHTHILHEGVKKRRRKTGERCVMCVCVCVTLSRKSVCACRRHIRGEEQLHFSSSSSRLCSSIRYPLVTPSGGPSVRPSVPWPRSTPAVASEITRGERFESADQVSGGTAVSRQESPSRLSAEYLLVLNRSSQLVSLPSIFF